jgi:hypothetical protein
LLGGWYAPQLAAVAVHLERMKKVKVNAREIFKVELAADLDVAATALYQAEAET